jgi:hypothetical protein
MEQPDLRKQPQLRHKNSCKIAVIQIDTRNHSKLRIWVIDRGGAENSRILTNLRAHPCLGDAQGIIGDSFLPRLEGNESSVLTELDGMVSYSNGMVANSRGMMAPAKREDGMMGSVFGWLGCFCYRQEMHQKKSRQTITIKHHGCQDYLHPLHEDCAPVPVQCSFQNITKLSIQILYQTLRSLG